MPALTITAQPRAAANDIEADVTTAELDWLEHHLRATQSFTDLSDPAAAEAFETAWLRLELLAIALGMPENHPDGVVAWAEDHLRHNGRPVHQPAAQIVGTPEYRQRHIAMLWQAQLWHEAVQVAFVAVTLGLLFYAVAVSAQ